MSPSSEPPPSGSARLATTSVFVSSRVTQITATSSSSAATITRFTTPIAFARAMVMAGPASAPALPPAAMKP